MKTHRHVVLLEKSQHVILVPRRVPEFDGVLHRGIARQSIEEFLNSFEVLVKLWRQLVENGPQLRVQFPRALEERLEWRLRCSNFFICVR